MSEPNYKKVSFHRYSSGFFIYEVNDGFEVAEKYIDTNGGFLHLKIGTENIEIAYKSDYIDAVSRLKQIGWTDKQINKVFNELDINYNNLGNNRE